MMKYIFYTLIICTSFSCINEQRKANDILTEEVIEAAVINPPDENRKNNIIDPLMELDSTTHQKAYKRLLSQIKQDKSQLLQGLNQGNITMDSVEHYFTRIMRDSIFHYWYGTTWEFNGHTDIPRNGEVACGYFISTPLKHIGVNVNRYKLAQQAATPIIKSISPGKNIYRTADIKALESYLDEQVPDGLYVIGLSFHVGYILREKGKNFMVHSDYYEPIAVCKKSLATCEALHSSEVYVLGELSGNPTFLRKWLRSERINIVSN